MTFYLFLMATATVFLRPGELIPAIAELPLYDGLMVGCCVGCARGLRQQLEWRRLVRQPVTLCVLGLVAAVFLSHLSRFYLTGALESTTRFGKTVVYYLLLVMLVDSPDRLKKYLLTVAGCATLTVGLCVADYLDIYDVPSITHYAERDGVTITNDEHRVLRMRGTGIFEDPNDISLVIVTVAVLSLFFVGDERLRALRRAWLAPLGLMGLALLLTQSRGGLLAAGAAGVTLASCRYGRKAALAAGLLGVCALPLIAGRQGNISLSEGTGQDRLQIWSDGLAELKSPCILFGVGMGEYVEYAGYVAHNSYVHAFVELGFLGGTFFVGAFFFSALALYRLLRTGAPEIADPELRRLRPYLAAILATWSVGLLSLSRCYVVPTYLVLGLMSIFPTLAGQSARLKRPIVAWDRPHVTRLLAGSGAVLAGLFVFVRLFANWG